MAVPPLLSNIPISPSGHTVGLIVLPMLLKLGNGHITYASGCEPIGHVSLQGRKLEKPACNLLVLFALSK